MRIALLVVALAAGPAHAGSYVVTRSGAVLPVGAGAKSQAFCTANPDVVVAFDDALVFTPALPPTVLESAGPFPLSATITVQAVCLAGTTEIRLRYGSLPSSTAVPGSDFQPFTLSVGTPPLAQFSNPSQANATTAIQLINDTVQEPVGRIDIGLIGGELIFRNAGTVDFVSLSASPQPLATLTITDDDDLDPGNITDTLTPLAAGDPVASAAIAPFAATCSAEAARPPADQNAQLLAQCRAIVNNNTADVVEALRAISGEEVTSQLTGAQDNANFVNQGVSQRLAALRGGATRQSMEDVAITYDGVRVPTSSLAAMLGLQDDDYGGGLYDQRLGLFANVAVRDGDRDANEFEVGFDYDGFQALAGLDYRFTDRFVSGLALGIGRLEATLDAQAGAVDSDSTSVTWYGSWLPNQTWYVDYAVAYLKNDYAQSRLIDLSSLGTGFARSFARGDTDGAQWSLAGSAGFDLVWGETTLTPNARFAYARTEIDGFTERGGDINDLIFPDQDFRSLQFAIGANLRRAISIASGVLTPYANLEFAREQKNDAYSFAPLLRIRPEQPSTPIFVNESDRSFGRGEVGIYYLRPGGFQISASYLQMLGYRDLNARSVQIGLRWEF